MTMNSRTELGNERSNSHLSDHENLLMQAFVKYFQPSLNLSKDVPEVAGIDPVRIIDSVNNGSKNVSALETVDVLGQELPEGELLHFGEEDLSYLLDPITEEGELFETEEYEGSGNENLMVSMDDEENEEMKEFTDIEENKEEQIHVGPVKKKLPRGGAVLAGASSKKRLAHILFSPRKKAANKNGVPIGDGLHSKNETGKKI